MPLSPLLSPSDKEGALNQVESLLKEIGVSNKDTENVLISFSFYYDLFTDPSDIRGSLKRLCEYIIRKRGSKKSLSFVSALLYLDSPRLSIK